MMTKVRKMSKKKHNPKESTEKSLASTTATFEGIDMVVRNNSSIDKRASKKRGMVLPFQPLSLAFNHVNYYVDMPEKMAAEPTKEHVNVADTEPSASSTDNVEKTKNKIKKGVFSMKWNSLFRSKKDDFEKRLQHIFKEEAAVIARINKRYQNWRRIARHLIVLSVVLEENGDDQI